MHVGLCLSAILFCAAIYSPTEPEKNQTQSQLYLSLNVDSGSRLQFSDGSTYEIAPADQVYSSSWLSPFPVMMEKSGNSEYPVKITNLQTKTSVNAKPITKEEFFKKDEPAPVKPTPKTAPRQPAAPTTPTQPQQPAMPTTPQTPPTTPQQPAAPTPPQQPVTPPTPQPPTTPTQPKQPGT